MYWKATLVLGVIVIWTLLPRPGLPSPGFKPKLFTEFISVTELADPTVQVIASGFHDAGYEDAWVQFVDEKERLVQVQAVDSRIVIVFRLKKREDLARFPEGSSITPVTPRCRGGGTDCDMGSQEKLYVGNVEVQPVMWKTYGSNRKLKIRKP